MQIHFTVDTHADRIEWLKILAALAGTNSPATSLTLNVAADTTELVKAVQEQTKKTPPETTAKQQIVEYVKGEIKDLVTEQETKSETTTTANEKVTVDDLKPLMVRFIKNKELGGAAGMTKVLQKFGAECLIGKNELDPKHYPAFKGHVLELLGE